MFKGIDGLDGFVSIDVDELNLFHADGVDGIGVGYRGCELIGCVCVSHDLANVEFIPELF